MPRSATCHPDRPYVARGFCRACYQREHWAGRIPQARPGGRGRPRKTQAAEISRPIRRTVVQRPADPSFREKFAAAVARLFA